MLDAWDPVKLLDSTPFNKIMVYSSGNTELVNEILQQPPELEAAVSRPCLHSL